nr:hypothetical protein [Tanacetum cinerariifolium]
MIAIIIEEYLRYKADEADSYFEIDNGNIDGYQKHNFDDINHQQSMWYDVSNKWYGKEEEEFYLEEMMREFYKD